MSKDRSVGIVADWLVTYAGAERVIKEFVDLYPKAELYSVVDFLSDESRQHFHNKKATTTFIQNYLVQIKSIKNIYPSCHWLLNNWMFLLMTLFFPVAMLLLKELLLGLTNCILAMSIRLFVMHGIFNINILENLAWTRE
ncbi:Uncharacterised protein [Raoultella terrigena]|uniref:Glycosyl transferase n=1 Tax=Raoultella terrigena TaxID=577 RepID=A0A4U9D2B4_RAOTE|nr:Uncharacterised protein [Raoultella terrigena]